MLSATETLNIEQALRKLKDETKQALHYTHDADGMLLDEGADKVFHIVLDWMDQNIECIKFKPRAVNNVRI